MFLWMTVRNNLDINVLKKDAWMEVSRVKNDRIEQVGSIISGLNYRICIMIVNAWYGCDHSEEIVHPLHWTFSLTKKRSKHIPKCQVSIENDDYI